MIFSKYSKNQIKNMFILFLIFISTIVYSQNEIKNNDEIIGIIISNSEPVIITNSGYYKIENKSKDMWKEYYQRIYKDTTISNPNTELKNEYSINIIPYVISSTEVNNKYNFDEPIKFGLFFHLDENKKYYLSKYGRNLIDSLQNAH